jgi:hypothetical protein
MNIRYITGELLLDPNRVCYTQISVDVEVSTLSSNMEEFTEFAFRSRSVISRRNFAFSTFLATWLANDFLDPSYDVLAQAYEIHSGRWWV